MLLRIPKLRIALCLFAGVLTTTAIAWTSALRTRVAPQSTPRESFADPNFNFDLHIWNLPAGSRVSLTLNGASLEGEWTEAAIRMGLHAAASSFLTHTQASNRWPAWSARPQPEQPGILWVGEIQDARGWPMLALRCRWLIDWGSNPWSGPWTILKPVSGGIELLLEKTIAPLPRTDTTVRALPLTPIWPGFLINTTLFAAILFIPWSTVAFLRTHLRRRRGHCPKCNYDLKADFASGCPECGWNKQPDHAAG